MDFVRVDTKDHITTITLDRPEVLNAINPQMQDELQAAFDGFAADPDQFICVVTGAGEHLTIIPSMDTTTPVDVNAMAATTPRECRFLFAETVTFGPDVAEFHKTTFQDPPDGALISEGAATYRDAETSRRGFRALVDAVGECAEGAAGQALVGDWTADATSLHLGPGGCGRDYRVLSLALLEVTFCGFPQSVSDTVMANIAANVPG